MIRVWGAQQKVPRPLSGEAMCQLCVNRATGMRRRRIRLLFCVVLVVAVVVGSFFSETVSCSLTRCRNLVEVLNPGSYRTPGGDYLSLEPLMLNSTTTTDFTTAVFDYTPVKNYTSFEEALKDRADSSRKIILLSVDAGYIDMGLNILETSLRKLGISNYLFVCSDEVSAQRLNAVNASCFLRKVDFGTVASNYGSRAFVQKTHIKTYIILEALQLGYTVMILDVDIVLFQNPMPYFNCKDCDVQIQTDGHEANTGFYLVRPTKAGIEMHRRAIEMSKSSKSATNQMTLDRTMERMTKARTMKVKYLNVYQFPHGQQYFEKGMRAFAGDNPCSTCVMVHNNWIVSKAGKIYRFKEHLMWAVDRDQYYSNPRAKYLAYDNPLDFDGGKRTIEAEKQALRNAFAIGHVLNRIVILPTFHCYGCKYQVCKNEAHHCPLNTHLKVGDLDGALGGLYREHMFLKHMKVPKAVKNSVSDLILIETDKLMPHKTHASFSEVKEIFNPRDTAGGATSSELRKWLQSYEDVSVLRFHSLYHAFKEFNSEEDNHSDFGKKLKDAFKSGDYRQY